MYRLNDTHDGVQVKCFSGVVYSSLNQINYKHVYFWYICFLMLKKKADDDPKTMKLQFSQKFEHNFWYESLLLNLNLSCGYSKELYHCDSSFEYPQHRSS